MGVFLEKGPVPNRFRFELNDSPSGRLKGMICWSEDSVIGRTQSARIRIDERLVMLLLESE